MPEDVSRYEIGRMDQELRIVSTGDKVEETHTISVLSVTPCLSLYNYRYRLDGDFLPVLGRVCIPSELILDERLQCIHR